MRPTAISRSPVQRSELYPDPVVSIQWLGVLIFALATDAPLLWCPDHGENVGAESVYYMPPLQAPLGTADYCCRLQLLLPTVACFMRASSFHLIGSVLNIMKCSKSQLLHQSKSACYRAPDPASTRLSGLVPHCTVCTPTPQHRCAGR